MAETIVLGMLCPTCAAAQTGSQSRLNYICKECAQAWNRIPGQVTWLRSQGGPVNLGSHWRMWSEASPRPWPFLTSHTHRGREKEAPVVI